MFIEQAIQKENKFWKYLLGSLLVILASSIAQIPLLVAIFLSPNATPLSQLNSENMFAGIDSNLSLFLMSLTFVGGLIGLFFVAKWMHNQSFKSLITSSVSVRWSRVFFSFTIWSLIVIGTTLADYFMHPKEFVLQQNWNAFLVLVVVAVLMLPIQTSCEELIFRGYLLQGFGNLAGNKWFPLLMTSLIFGLLHISNPEVDKMGYTILIYYIGTGFFLGIITLVDEGMELALGFHAANNLIGALMVTSSWTVFQTNSIFKDVSEPMIGYDVLLPVFVIYPLLLLLFGKKYKWNNWISRLTGKLNLPH